MRKFSLTLAFALVLAACGGSGSATSTTTTTVTTTTAATTTTTTPPPPTVESTTTTSSTTTTTMPPALSFEVDGLGIVDFGASPDDVIATLTALFGPSLRDTGWVDEPLCPGPMNRFVDFGVDLFDFQVMFTTGDLFAPAGTEHFYTYRYNGGTPVPISPPDLTVGTTVAQLQALYPGVIIDESPFVVGDYVYLFEAGPNEALSGNLSGNGAGDVVLSVQGGIGCGE